MPQASTVPPPWRATSPASIFSRQIRAADTYNSTSLIDFRYVRRINLRVVSTLDEPIVIQTVGNYTPSFDGATNINGPLSCLADSVITIGLAWDDWHPYIGVVTTVAVAPTTGTLVISYTLQG